MPVLPLLIPVFVFGFIAYGVSTLVPGTTPSTVLLAQAGSAFDYAAMDKKCDPDYSYSARCKGSANFDTQTGQKCGFGMRVETSQVKGQCINANVAEATDYKGADGEWHSLNTMGKPDPLQKFYGAAFNETTGQMEYPPPVPGWTPKIEFEFKEPIISGSIGGNPYTSGTIYNDQGDVVSPEISQNSVKYPTPEITDANSYPPSPSTQIPQFQQNELFQQQPLPPEFQPSTDQKFYVDAQGNLQQGNPYTAVLNSGTTITQQPAPASAGFFQNTFSKIGNFFKNLF